MPELPEVEVTRASLADRLLGARVQSARLGKPLRWPLGVAPESLLDSYETERSPHVREFIETAVRLGAIIQATDPAVVARRNAEMTASPQVFSTPQPALGRGTHDGGAFGGRIAAQPVFDDGSRFDDAIGYRFALVVQPALATAATVLVGTRAVVVPATTVALQAWLAGFDAAAVLVRPDRYVAGTAADEATLRTLLQRQLGAEAG